MKTDHSEHTAGGFVGRRSIPGLEGVTGASVRSIAIPPPGVAPMRPRTRGDCIDGPRPCPWVSCWHHLLPGHVGEKVTHQADTSDEALLAVLESMPDTCDLDAADRGGATLEEIAQSFSVTREWIRQIESKALKRLDKRVDHLRDVIVEEHASELRPRSCGPVPASESRGWTAPSPRYAHLPGPADVTDAAQEFWCGHMGTALSARLCTRRHLARHRVSSDRVVRTYPECARCTDGAGIAARLGVSEAPVPQRDAPMPSVPEPTAAAAAVDRMGDADDGAQADAEQLAVVEPDVASDVPAEVLPVPEVVHRDVKPPKPRKPRAAPVQRGKVVRVRVQLPEHPVVALIQAFATRARKVRRA